MDSRWDILIARCQATTAQTAELLKHSMMLERQLRVTLNQIRQSRARRYGMLISELGPLDEA